MHSGQIGGPLGGGDGTETGVLDHPRQALRPNPGRGQGLRVEQIGLQPAQGGTVIPMTSAGLHQGLATEIQTRHREAQLRQQSRLMATTAAWHQHPAGRPWSPILTAEERLQRRGRSAQLPGIGAVAVAPIPVSGAGRRGCSGAVVSR